MIVVYPDDDKLSCKLAYQLANVDTYDMPIELRQLFIHEIAISTRAHFSSIGFLYGGAKPKYVTGYRLEEEMLEINWELNNLILGADFLPLRWSQLASLLINKELPVRRILILAHSVGHSIALLSDRGVKSEKWDAFRLYTAELRRKSLNEGVDKQEVMDLLRESEVITRELMVAIEKELNFEMGGDSVSCPEPRYLINQLNALHAFSQQI